MSLPLSSFTIVFNGHKFVRPCILALLNQCERVVVVEGATNREQHHLGLGIRIAHSPSSTDGTVEVLRDLQAKFGKDRLRVIYANQTYWPNKTTMVQNALGHCLNGLLIQRDVDEFWYDDQVKILRYAMEHGGYSDVEFHCRHFWSGPDYYCAIGKGWGGGDPWRRAWTWNGERVLSHEPPRFRLRWERILSKEDTRALDLVFDHYSYADMHNVRQKEKFYNLKPNELVTPMALWRRQGFPSGKAACGPVTKYEGTHPIDVTWMEVAK